jgi:hypothetical protein
VSMCVCVCVCLRESVGVVSMCVQKRPDNHLIPYAIIEIGVCIRGKRVTFILRGACHGSALCLSALEGCRPTPCKSQKDTIVRYYEDYLPPRREDYLKA